MTFTRGIGWVCGKIIDRIVGALALSRIHPNVLTALGLVINTWAAFLFAAGSFRWAGWRGIISITFWAWISLDMTCTTTRTPGFGRSIRANALPPTIRSTRCNF